MLNYRYIQDTLEIQGRARFDQPLSRLHKMMSDSLGGAENVQVRQVQLFENERYSPLSGWSSKALLPTDRHAITTCDGRDGFSNLTEATSAFSSLGMFNNKC